MPLLAQLESQDVALSCEAVNVTVCPPNEDCGTWTNEDLIKNGLSPMTGEGISISKFELPDKAPIYFVEWGLYLAEATKIGNVLTSSDDGDSLGGEFTGKNINYFLNLVTLAYENRVVGKSDQHTYITNRYQCIKSESLFD